MSCGEKSSKLDKYVSKRVKELKKNNIPEEDFESIDVMGVSPSQGGSVGNTNFYATGDNRIPNSLFGRRVVKRTGISSKKKKKSDV